MFVDNPRLLFTLDQPPTYNYYGDNSCSVAGVVMVDKYIYVAYHCYGNSNYKKVHVFDSEDQCKKIKDIEVKKMKETRGIVGSSVTSQLFISDAESDVVWRVHLKTGVSDVFVKTGIECGPIVFHWLRIVCW